jgi:hypothetical protein
MAKKAYVYSGTDWVPLASEVTDLTAYSTSTEIANTYATKAENGLVHINTTSFSAVASQSVDNVFSADYDRYVIYVSSTDSTGNGDIYLRLRASSTDSTTSYYYGITGMRQDGTAANRNADPANHLIAGRVTTTADRPSIARIDLDQVFTTNRTVALIQYYSASSTFYYSGAGGGTHNIASSYDGFTILPSTGNFSGTVVTFGVKQ